MNKQIQILARRARAPMQHFTHEPRAILRRKCACGGSAGGCRACEKSNATFQSSKPLFGHDFSKVRLHAVGEAAESGLTGPVLQRQDAGADAGSGGSSGSTSGTTSVPPASTTGAPPAPTTPVTAPALNLTATRIAFNTSGAPNAANCAILKPGALGVGVGGTARNNMEMIFRIDGTIPAGTEFDILRTRVSTAWQRDAAGAWTVLERDPAGTNDDHTNDDECLTPRANRIFVVDTPGLPRVDPTGITLVGGSTVAATATGFVRKFSFAEWVIARNRSLGVDWKVISKPTFTFWHSITSVAKVGGAFRLVDTPSGRHNEIALGSISTADATP